MRASEVRARCELGEKQVAAHRQQAAVLGAVGALNATAVDEEDLVGISSQS